MRLGTRSAQAHAAGGDQLEDDRDEVGQPDLLGNAGLGAERQPRGARQRPHRDEGQAAGDPDGEHPVAADPAQQERPAELHLGAEDEEEPEAPPLGEVLGSDGEVDERGAGGRDGGDHERQR